MKTFTHSLVVASILAVSAAMVNAAEPGSGENFYAGAEIGRATFDLGSSGAPRLGSDKNGTALKLYGGYQLSEHFGVEGGYVHFGSLSQTIDVDGAAVRQEAKARSFYGAVTGRMPVSESFALTGKAGLSLGNVSGGGGSVPASSSLTGSSRSLLLGVGAEYRPTSNMTLTVGYDHFGKLSEKVSANMLNAGLRYSF